jgi:hypothetical protein
MGKGEVVVFEGVFLDDHLIAWVILHNRITLIKLRLLKILRLVRNHRSRVPCLIIKIHNRLIIRYAISLQYIIKEAVRRHHPKWPRASSIPGKFVLVNVQRCAVVDGIIRSELVDHDDTANKGHVVCELVVLDDYLLGLLGDDYGAREFRENGVKTH